MSNKSKLAHYARITRTIQLLRDELEVTDKSLASNHAWCCAMADRIDQLEGWQTSLENELLYPKAIVVD
jgi:hypothetical protein